MGRENSRTRLLDMWHAIDTMYGFPITERVIFDLDTQALWFDSEEYLNSHIFFELFCNTLFQIIEDDNCYKRQFYKDVLPPHGCPSFEEVINHDGKIIELLREQLKNIEEVIGLNQIKILLNGLLSSTHLRVTINLVRNYIVITKEWVHTKGIKVLNKQSHQRNYTKEII